MTPYNLGQRNFRSGITGNPADNNEFAPIAPVGVYSDMRYGALSNRGNTWVNPIEAGGTRDGHAVYASWAEYWAKEFDPIHAWFTGSGATRNMRAVFESPYGSQGVYRRDHTIDERTKAIEQGKGHLVVGFTEGARTYIDAGSEIWIHEGCPDLGRLAADTLKDETPRGQVDFLQACWDFIVPHLSAGMGIGLDNLSAWDERSASYGLWQLLKNIGCQLQMEASYGPAQELLYGGSTIFAHWSFFRQAHLEPQATWAKKGGIPIVGTLEFGKYAEFRVVLPYDVAKETVPVDWSQAYIEAVADKTRELLAGSHNIRVLLSEWLVRGAMQLEIPVERFLEVK